MVEKIQANFIQTSVTAPAAEKKQDEKDNKESNDFVKKHAVEIGLGAAALAAAVIGGIYYMKRGKGEDAAEAVVKKGEEIIKGTEKKASKTPEPELKTENQAEASKPAKPTEELKPEVKETTSQEIKPAIETFSPAVIKEAQELLDGAPKNLKEVLEETQKQVDNYDFIKNPLSTDFASYAGEFPKGPYFISKDIIDKNGKIIMKVWSKGGEKVYSIELYNPKTGKEAFYIEYKGGKLRSITDYDNKKVISLEDGKVCFTYVYEGEIHKSNFIEYNNNGYVTKFKYDNEINQDIPQMNYFYHRDDKKTINVIEKFDEAGENHVSYHFNTEGSLNSVRNPK